MNFMPRMVMAKVIAELEHDLEGLEQAKQQAADDEEYSRAAEPQAGDPHC